MSTETVQKFWQKVHTDQSLQAQLSAIREKERHATVAAVVKVAAVAGFVFNAADYEAAIKERLARQHAAGELNYEQIEAIGGAGSATRLLPSKLAQAAS